MQKTWEAAMAHLTYGIYVLTSAHEAKINGMIASWVSQVSYDPPQILVAVHPHRYTCHLISQSRYFALHTLNDTQTDCLKRFKGPDPLAKFSSLAWHPGQTGCPIIDACTAFFECRVITQIQPGNHILFVGEILQAQVHSQDKRLSTADYQGCYLGKK